MKPSADNLNEENMDLLLFSYLEGDLTAAQMAALDAKLATDPALQVEMDHWKETFVEEEIFDTSSLEKQLLREDMQLVDTPLSYHIFVAVLVFFITAFHPVAVTSDADRKLEKSIYHLPVVTAIKPEMVEAEVSQDAAPISPISVLQKPAMKSTTTVAPATEKPSLEIIAPIEMLSVASFGEEATILPLAPDFKPIKVKVVPAKASLSRKQRKEINKLKEKARQQRQAEEFLKGNRPYVVPLDSKNF